MSEYSNNEFVTLVLLALQGDITNEQMFKLNEIMSSDPSYARSYAELLHLYVELSPYGSVEISKEERNFRPETLQSFSNSKIPNPTVVFPHLQEEPQAQGINCKPLTKISRKEKRQVSKLSLLTLTTSVAALIMIFVMSFFSSHNSKSIEVARVKDEINVQWGESSNNIKPSSSLWTNQGPLSLEEGIITIRYNDGVEVIIEAPAVFEIERSGLFMEYGRLYSSVSQMGLGFTVKTPTTQFIDHGTEFGIKAYIDGSSELHVVKGMVQLFAGTEGKTKNGQMVTQNLAVKYETSSNEIKDIKIEKKSFVRHINSKTKTIWRGQEQVDLADMIGGGDGFGSGKVGYCVNILNGNIQSFVTPGNIAHKKLFFIEVPDSYFVDSIFLPDSSMGDVVVSTQMDIFKDCPDTSGWTNRPPTNGGERIFSTDENKWPLMIDWERCGTKDYPAICMVSNSGITFDLEHIREGVPGANIVSFRTQIAFSSNVNISEADASSYILIDGKPLYIDKQVTIKSKDVYIPITEEDRFLTLVTTDNGNNKNDWVLYGRPRLDIE